MLSLNDLKNIGIILEIDGAPYAIVSSLHTHVANRRASVRVKLKNLITGQALEKTFSSSDKIEEASTSTSKASFLYPSGEDFYFMNDSDYEQFALNEKILGTAKNFLKEGLEVEVLLFNERPISIKIPKKIDLRVIEAPPSVKGDSATTPSKTVTIETGAQLTVPIFIKEGDIIKINTDTGEYVSRV